MRKLIIFVVIVLALLVGVDRVGDLVAERVTADTLQNSQHLQQRPDVSIDGFPFLTQFASGHYGHVEIDAHDVRVGSTKLQLSDLRTDFRTVTVSHDFHDFRARTGTATATVDYADLSALLGIDVRYAGGGRLSLSADLPVIGRRTVTFKADYADGALRFGQGAVNGLGELGSEVTAALNKYVGVRTSLRDFPFDVQVRRISVNAGGLQIALAGSKLHYSTS